MKIKLFFKILTGFHFSAEDFCIIGYILAKKSGFFLKRRYKKFSEKNGIEIDSFQNIDSGLNLVHPYCITINPLARIGKNCVIFKGATVGSIRSGKRKGFPTIGDNVVIGLNSTIVGGVTIGDDVFVAPNAFVNFDVPSHSLVIGNPGVIIAKESGRITSDYLKKD